MVVHTNELVIFLWVCLVELQNWASPYRSLGQTHLEIRKHRQHNTLPNIICETIALTKTITLEHSQLLNQEANRKKNGNTACENIFKLPAEKETVR